MSTAPTVYFIDDSATMREVIKIAFRRENIEVVACHDGSSALAQMQEQHPDVVISDVIMPGMDGYAVCEQVKQSPHTASTPVVLMSGVVNRAVADKAFACKADELIRKPFQPQDLIARVRQLLQGKRDQGAPVVQAEAVSAAAAALSGIFSTPLAERPAGSANGTDVKLQQLANGASRIATAARSAAIPAVAGLTATENESPEAIGNPAGPSASSAPGSVPFPRAGGGDLAKLRVEILRLENLVRKLQSELQAEREYSRALEEHVKTLQESE